ncbi:hypothetical protein SCLCIDRAFT_1214818 [Scleroderma citrinum Foug A]|uniref:Uncharacterized protein n=1 Tax=Scleroderma citrinum Foug A TaxID=1036808 RepID=A0A0C3E3W2_9AGAM|nr:hypothetical protein SCLCIDRAFT_1214818 [Scleroderma citrinum Foug A]
MGLTLCDRVVPYLHLVCGAIACLPLSVQSIARQGVCTISSPSVFAMSSDGLSPVSSALLVSCSRALLVSIRL